MVCTSRLLSVWLPAIGLVAVIALALLQVGPRRLCEGAGGKWASTQSSCITRSCVAAGTCGRWAYPSARCSLLKVGDTRSEVRFQLGDPNKADGDTDEWPAGKGEAGTIVATYNGDQLKSLSCLSTTP